MNLSVGKVCYEQESFGDKCFARGYLVVLESNDFPASPLAVSTVVEVVACRPLAGKGRLMEYGSEQSKVFKTRSKLLLC